MADWKENIAGCFGTHDAKFARHPSDEKRAFDLLTRLRSEGVGWSETSAAIWGHLKSKGARDEHINEEMERVESHFRAWLGD
jgi:hypothetical protein